MKNKISIAIDMATKAHEGQQRQESGLPYIVHPLEVMQILIEAGVSDEGTLIAAILHDTVEDTDTSFDDIRSVFGHRITEVVEILTVREGESKQEALDRISRLSIRYPEAVQIKAADRISNLRTMPSKWSASKRERYVGGARQIVRMLGVAKNHITERLAARLEDLIKIYST